MSGAVLRRASASRRRRTITDNLRPRLSSCLRAHPLLCVLTIFGGGRGSEQSLSLAFVGTPPCCLLRSSCPVTTVRPQYGSEHFLFCVDACQNRLRCVAYAGAGRLMHFAAAVQQCNGSSIQCHPIFPKTLGTKPGSETHDGWRNSSLGRFSFRLSGEPTAGLVLSARSAG